MSSVKSARYLILIPIALMVLGQISSKYGVRLFNEFGDIRGLFFLFFGYLVLFVRGFVWIGVLRQYAISYAYPMLSFAYVLVILFSWLIFKEVLSVKMILGVVIISLGIIFLQSDADKS